MADINTNPTPKEQFRAVDQHLSQHKSMMELKAFDRGTQYALLQYQYALASQRTVDPNTALANHFKMTGAIEFLGILRTMADSPHRPASVQPATLDHRA